MYEVFVKIFCKQGWVAYITGFKTEQMLKEIKTCK